jgi:hypothetical protein
MPHAFVCCGRDFRCADAGCSRWGRDAHDDRHVNGKANTPIGADSVHGRSHRRRGKIGETANGRSQAKGKSITMTSRKGEHTERENHPWMIRIPDHPHRRDSQAYLVARKVMNLIVKGMRDFFLGGGPYQDHHGGGLWLKDEDGWFLIKNLAGMEWSQQFCADPKKVDVLRQNAKRIYNRFPESIPGLKAMKFQNVDRILREKIDNPAKVARWCDSIFNASVPLSPPRHTGVLKPTRKTKGNPTIEGGVHHYPTPITDIQFFKRDDFQLWVADTENQLAAVTPMKPRHSGDGRVRVLYATPGTKMHAELLAAEGSGRPVIRDSAHTMAQQAFAAQYKRDARVREKRRSRTKKNNN